MKTFFDAHNHLQDERFDACRDRIVAEARQAGVQRMVVNGACAADWPVVAQLAQVHPDLVIPSLGWHPWYLHEQQPGWEDEFEGWLGRVPGALVGEIGLDRWILDQSPAMRSRFVPALGSVEPAPFDRQVEVFRFQLDVAIRRRLPVSIHCLQCWGQLLELLRQSPQPSTGFLLHSYGGPVELLRDFVRIGAYFSFPGYFLHERKARQREVFRHVPLDRLLVETDAPDQLPPTAFVTHLLPGVTTDRPLNHPANLGAIQAGLADILGEEPDALAARAKANFERLFGTFAGHR
jgi:TatD DNase family protein